VDEAKQQLEEYLGRLGTQKKNDEGNPDTMQKPMPKWSDVWGVHREATICLRSCEVIPRGNLSDLFVLQHEL
jgi:hypothetical protein